MEMIHWIKDLVKAEQKMEETGVIDLTADETSVHVEADTIDFLEDLKTCLVEAASAFNQLKGSTLGGVKVYSIAKTRADFMLFRNGFKLIFAMKRPGEIEIYYSTIGSLPGSIRQQEQPRETIQAKWGAFGELKWTFNGQPLKIDYLVRHYMTRFIKESAK